MAARGVPSMDQPVCDDNCPPEPIYLQNDFQKFDSQYTSGFLKPTGVLTARSVSQNINSVTAFGKI
jgi:hypothetical protein